MIKYSHRVASVALAVALWAAGSAPAAVIGYKLQIVGSGVSATQPAGDTNLPYFAVANLATSAKITALRITIGDARYNFDNAIYEGIAAGAATINAKNTWTTAPTSYFTQTTPDDNGTGGTRADFVRYTFPAFNPGRSFRWRSDIDSDKGDDVQDFRRVLFDLGGASAADNAQVTVAFSAGGYLTQALPDFRLSSSGIYSVSQSRTLPATSTPALAASVSVPEPGVGFILAGLAGVGLGRRRPREEGSRWES
jgi:hypothetical protein